MIVVFTVFSLPRNQELEEMKTYSMKRLFVSPADVMYGSRVDLLLPHISNGWLRIRVVVKIVLLQMWRTL